MVTSISKTVRLVAGKPEMVLEHRLKNTGRRAIQTSVYNHNFLVLDHQPPGPDFSLTVPFQIHSPQPPNKDLAEIRGNQFVYLKALANQDVVSTPMLGFSDSPKDNEIRIENSRVGRRHAHPRKPSAIAPEPVVDSQRAGRGTLRRHDHRSRQRIHLGSVLPVLHAWTKTMTSGSG